MVSWFAAVGPTAAALVAVLKRGCTAQGLLAGGLLLIIFEELAELIIEDFLVCLAIKALFTSRRPPLGHLTVALRLELARMVDPRELLPRACSSIPLCFQVTLAGIGLKACG